MSDNMLKHLSIKNIALISSLQLDLESNLCVLSGETGAGKSIIVDSLAFVLGGRADKNLIKSGEDSAFVEAVFEIDLKDDTATALLEYGFEADTTVVLSRVLNVLGKNECRINGRLCALSTLKAVSSSLAEIFGQNDHVNILKSDVHIKILDNFDKFNKLDELQILCRNYRDLKNKLAEYGGSEADRVRALDIISYEIKEIENANLKIDEEDQLNEYLAKVANSEKIAASLNNALSNLAEVSNVSGQIWLAASSLTSIMHFDKELADVFSKLESAKYEIDDIICTLENKLNDCDYDPNLIDESNLRLEVIKRLKKKYGATVNDVLGYLEKSKQKYNNYVDASAVIEEINAQMLNIKKQTYAISEELSAHRKAAAKRFCALVTSELKDLGILNATFEVFFADKPKFDNFCVSENGFDNAEFLFSANKGEPLKPLIKVISGGEMSRFLLAVKNITAKIEKIPTMVFDEIDVGLSGVTAQMVAEKLSNISKGYQCIVITHLPQVVAMGDNNYLIAKWVVGEKTHTFVTLINREQKIKEIARLMGGENIGEFSLKHAEEMLVWADKRKRDN